MDKLNIEKLLKDNENRHSDFQIENFIIKNQGDPWAQYKQCLREMDFRYEEITKHESKRDQLRAFRKNKKFKLLSIFSKKKRAYLFGLSADVRSNQKKTDDIYAELNCILKIAKQLKEQIGEVTDERRQQLELDSWTAKGRRMAMIDRVLTGGMSQQTLEFILSLPENSQEKIFLEVVPSEKKHLFKLEQIEKMQGR